MWKRISGVALHEDQQNAQGYTLSLLITIQRAIIERRSVLNQQQP